MGPNVSKGVLIFQTYLEIVVLGGPNISEIFVPGVHFWGGPILS